MSELNPSIAGIVMPRSIANLPIGPNGFPVPWFVAWVDGKPEFRLADAEKLRIAVQDRKCWVCGQPLNNRVTFVIGPMCTVNRISADPPSHGDCALYSAMACPFLSRPAMVRREGGMVDQGITAGEMIRRNPGVSCLWTTKSPGFQIVGDNLGGQLFQIFPPTNLVWMTEGRVATAREVRNSVDSGLPILREMAERQGLPAIIELSRMIQDAERFFPQE